MFRHCSFILAGVAVSAALAGCHADMPSGTRLSLGEVSYDEALAVGREVMRKHFELAPGNPGDSEIVALPRPVDARAQRILGGKSPTRQLATLRIQSQQGNVVAVAKVLLQRQGSAGFQQFDESGNYSTVPNATPSDSTAATTPEQNEAWETRGRDAVMERTIVRQLYDAIHPGKNP